MVYVICIQGKRDSDEKIWQTSQRTMIFINGEQELDENSIRRLKALKVIYRNGQIRICMNKKTETITYSKGTNVSYCEMSLCCYPGCTKGVCFEHVWGDTSIYE